ncbi:MAG: hypothetical protein IJH39_09195 [Clostridia bacterium]|nr:hypothetical protein [Clostridia bacterium]
MVKTFITSVKLENTCKVNKMINSLKKFTRIGSDISSDLYSNKGIKVIAGVLSVIKTVIELFGSKIIAIFMLYGLLMQIASEGFLNTDGNTFFHIFLFISLIECFAQSNLLDDGDKSYYAIVLLKMDAKKYILSTYYWKIFLRFISFVTVLILFRDIIGLSILTSVLYSIFNVMVKTIFNNFRINDYKKNRNTMMKLLWYVAVLCTILAIVPPIFKITIPLWLFEILCVIVFIYGIYSFYRLSKFDKYYKLYKSYLNPESKSVENRMQSFNIHVHDEIDIDKEVTGNKKGVKYLNSLFTARHKKKIYVPMIFQTVIAILEYMAIIYYSVYNSAIHEMLGYSFTVTYFIIAYGSYFISFTNTNRLTISWFEDCDHAMLCFKSFRTNKNIVELFKERFILLVKISILPTLVMSIGATIMFKVNMASEYILDYFVVFALGILICINTIMNMLLMYYIIQPNSYSENLKTAVQNKPFFMMLNFMGYMIILMLPTMFKLSIPLIGLVVATYTILHVVLGYIAIYKFATKTFRIKN